jgi:very-short-patch-repair endonuclease
MLVEMKCVDWKEFGDKLLIENDGLSHRCTRDEDGKSKTTL